MIHEVSGDILLTKAQAIAHGIAPNDHLDQGLALALREKWPMMAKDFRHYANQCHPEPGEIWAWGGFNARIFCLMTQAGEHSHGKKPEKASTANVNHCLRRLQHELEKGEIKSCPASHPEPSGCPEDSGLRLFAVSTRGPSGRGRCVTSSAVQSTIWDRHDS